MSIETLNLLIKLSAVGLFFLFCFTASLLANKKKRGNIILTKKRLIKECKCFTPAPFNMVFVIAGGFFFFVIIGNFITQSSAEVKNNPISYLALALYLIFPVWFGYTWGVKPMIGDNKEITQVKKDRFYIRKQKIVDKNINLRRSSNIDTELIFEDGSSIMVYREEGAQYVPGDYLYVFYFNGRKSNFAWYDAATTELDEELSSLLKETTNENFD